MLPGQALGVWAALHQGVLDTTTATKSPPPASFPDHHHDFQISLSQYHAVPPPPPASSSSSSAPSTSPVYNKNNLTWTPNTLRMNQIQVIGTHNSYHREPFVPAERAWHGRLLGNPENYLYSHASLPYQAEYQSVRSFELDIWADPPRGEKGKSGGGVGGNYAHPLVRRLANEPYPPSEIMHQPGAKVLHVADKDVGTSCYSLTTCLHDLRAWSRAHPAHVPISIMLEFKTVSVKWWDRLLFPYMAESISWNDPTLLDALDDEIRAVFPPEELIVPDDLRRNDGDESLTLEQSVLAHGWPDLSSARGRFFFIMDDGLQTLGLVRNTSIIGRPNLEGRVVFTQSAPGQPDCAFQKLNNPLPKDFNGGKRGGGKGSFEEIREAVRKGYWVRTRADIPIETVLGKGAAGDNITAMRDEALSSGAQVVSTDWPAVGQSARYGVDYAVILEGGRTAKCNPVNAPESCGQVDEFTRSS